jgi:hypothetical protein
VLTLLIGRPAGAGAVPCSVCHPSSLLGALFTFVPFNRESHPISTRRLHRTRRRKPDVDSAVTHWLRQTGGL